jgi:hypothetical protein
MGVYVCVSALSTSASCHRDLMDSRGSLLISTRSILFRVRLVPLGAGVGAVSPEAGRERGGRGARRERKAAARAPGGIAPSCPATACVGGEREARGGREWGGSVGMEREARVGARGGRERGERA